MRRYFSTKNKIINSSLLSFLIIGFAWFLFSSPFFLKGRVPYPSTYQVTFFSPWSSYEQFGQPVKNNAMPDVIGQIYPWRKLTIDTWKLGQIPLWNPYSFSGTPHLANYQSAVFSPTNLLFFILPFVTAWSMLILLQSLLAGIFMYMFVRTLKVSHSGSVISSLAFMFCGFIVTWGSYGTLGYAILLLPLALFSIEKYLAIHKFRYLMLLSLTIPGSFFSGHFQISIYFLLFICAYIAFKFLTHTEKKRVFDLCVFTLCGIFLSFLQILPSIEAYNLSLRSNLFQKTEAIPWGYVPTFLSPDFFGNPVTRNDWFGHYAEWNAYIGVIPFMLGIYALMRKRLSLVYFFGITAVVSFLLAFQSPLLDLLVLLKIPVLSTSAASRIIVLFSFSIAVLAGFGLDSVLQDIKEKKYKFLLLWIGGFFVVFASLWAVVLLNLFLPLDKIHIAKSNLQLPTLIFLASIFIIASGIVIKKKNVTVLISFVLIIIVIADLIRFSSKWQPFEQKSLVFPEVASTQAFQQLAGFERAYGNYGGEVSVYYNLPSVEGYDAVYPRRYGQFIAALNVGFLREGERSVVNFPKHGVYAPDALNFLGIKYIVHKASDGRNVWAFPFWTYPQDQFVRIFNDGKYEILENKRVFPRVFFVKNYSVEADSKKLMKKLLDTGLNRNSAILEENPRIPFAKDLGLAEIKQYTPNKVVIETDSKQDSLLVLTDSYHPGWTARVDNKPTKIYRADFAFRSIVVPKGHHTVEFIYQPMSFMQGSYFAGLGMLGMIMFLVLQHMRNVSKISVKKNK